MSRFASLILLLPALPLFLAACFGSPQYTADVKLQIDGKSMHYTTPRAVWDALGGPPSVYLMASDVEDGASPYLCLRFYSGNPVGHFWIRYSETGEETGSDRPKFECFVPGVLSDGTETVSWTKKDGSERQRTDTGEAGCKVSVTKDGDLIRLEYDVVATQDVKGKGGRGHGGGGDAGESDDHAPTIKARGSAVLDLSKVTPK
jgi:hypothetical protein